MTTDKSQNPRIFEIGRDYWRSSGPTLLNGTSPAQDHIEHAAGPSPESL